MARKAMETSDSSDEDGTPLSQTQVANGSSTAANFNPNGKRTRRAASESSSLSKLSDEDKPPEPKRSKSTITTDSAASSTIGAGPQTNGTSNGMAGLANGRNNKRKQPPPSSSSESLDDDSEDDKPLKTTLRPASPSRTPAPKVEPDSSDEDGVPLQVATTSNGKGNGSSAASKPRPSRAAKTKAAVKQESDADDDSDDDVPLAAPKAKKAAPKGRKKPSPKRVKKEETSSEESESDSSDDAPLGAKAKPRRAPAAKAKAVKKSKSESAPPATPVKSKGKGKAKVKEEEDETATPGKKAKKKKKDDEEEEEVHRWWETEQIQGDGSVKWNTLEHAGVLFPPPYKPLPTSVKMRYDGKDVTLSPAAEEVAGFFAALLDTDHAADAKFRENFFNDWLIVLRDNPMPDHAKIKSFDKCDFRPMALHFEAEKAAKKSMSAADKKQLKAERDELEAPYKTCLLDGRKEKVGNFRVEPPGLFRGRGEHPRKGSLKFRVTPEDITLNIGENTKIPKPNMPGEWGKVIHDNTVTWLANWKENINGNFKYVFLAAGSSLKGQSDMMKFEKARELKKHIARIRQDYNNDLKSKVTAERQRATAMYFIDKLALRAGNEKGEDEADTVGCCSLRYEHVTLEPPNKLIFDFLGKDSIRYYNVVEVDLQVFKNMRIFKGDGKTENDAIFDRVTTTSLNKHLQSYMKGLTAKVFRTYNASITFQQQLDANTRDDMTDAEKLAAYHEANRMVAILCNHQKSVSKNHGASMEKMSDKLRGLKYQRMKLRYTLFTLDPKAKKKHNELQEMESDIDDEFVVYWEGEMKKRDIEKAQKKFEKTNEALEAEGKKPEPEKTLKAQIERIEEEYEQLAEERGSEDVNTGSFKDTDKVLAAIDKLDQKIRTFKVNMDVKDKGKDVSLGTSKINYLDPRITAAWCKKFDIDISKLFSKTLLTKFPWAMEVDDEWKF